MEQDRTRRLAAIMFADMVGYTALMQEDEENARSLRDRHRQVATELVPRYQGTVLQHYGDGTLSVFGSAVKAVECAVAIQEELAREPEVSVRIGVHTGDIVQDQEGIYGDGVNVAARIQALSAPGGVLVSAKVFDEIKNHQVLSTTPLGTFPLKNVKAPVEVYAISNEGLTVPDQATVLALAGVADPRASLVPGTDEIFPSDRSSADPQGPGEAFLLAVKERAMIQWGLVYLAAAWVVLEIGGFATEAFQWPPAISRGLSLLAFIGFFIALVVTWYHGKRGAQRIRKTEVLLIGALLAVAGVALATLEPGDRALGPPGTEGVVETGDSRPGIAVLPFENFSPDEENAYFANGLQEDITSALSRIGTLRVPGRSSVEQFRDHRPSAREMAEILGADYLLEGSARIVSGTVKVTVQLIDGRTDEHLWARDFDRTFSVEDVIEIQSQVAQAVATQLRAMIRPEEAARIAALPTRSRAAFEYYHRARFRWNVRTEAAVREAVDLLQRSIELDPEYAAAHVALADAYLVLANWGWENPATAFSRALAAAERAVELDPAGADAHASLGGLHLWHTRDWRASESEFLAALELDPEHSYAHFWYSALLSSLGRHDEAVSHAEVAQSLDPLAPAISSGPSRAFFMKRDFRRAVAEAGEALDLHPDFANLHSLACSALIGGGEYAAAEEACRRHQEVMGVSHSLNLAILRAYQGERDLALAEVEGARENAGTDLGQPVIEAMAFAGLGDADEAMTLLLHAEAGEFPHLEYLSTHPFFDKIRADQRFQDLLRRLGFQTS